MGAAPLASLGKQYWDLQEKARILRYVSRRSADPCLRESSTSCGCPNPLNSAQPTTGELPLTVRSSSDASTRGSLALVVSPAVAESLEAVGPFTVEKAHLPSAECRAARALRLERLLECGA